MTDLTQAGAATGIRQLPVSICIPAFNAAHQLADSLGSALKQTYANLDILVYDNASTDGTAEAVRRLAEGDSRVRYLKHASNVGMIRNFSACVSEARGHYVKFICADDALEPDCVERMVGAAAAHPQASLIACARQLVDERLQPVGVERLARQPLLEEGAAAIRRCFFSGNRIGEPTAVMFRRADAARGFRADYRQLVDLEMWIHLLRQGALAYLPQPLCRVRRHASQATQQHLAAGIVLDDKRRFFREFRSEAAGSATFFEKFLWDFRMGVTVSRTRRTGHSVRPQDVEEVFYPGAFAGLVYPAAAAAWRVAGSTG